MSVLIFFALKEEAAPFRKIAAGKSDISILLTGIGRGNAGKSVRAFLGSSPASDAAVDALLTAKANDAAAFATREGARAPQLVLTCGFAGGLNPDLKLGDVIFEIGNQKSEIGNQLAATGAKPAKFFCADSIATTAAEKKQLREQTGADAVEMESAAIHAVCAEHGIPCATVRVISDTASEDLPLDFNALTKPDKNLDFGKLAWAIAKSPGKVGALMELQKKIRFAAGRLAEVLFEIIR
jgi:adenosylhomocysteine nucleosidase